MLPIPQLNLGNKIFLKHLEIINYYANNFSLIEGYMIKYCKIFPIHRCYLRLCPSN